MSEEEGVTRKEDLGLKQLIFTFGSYFDNKEMIETIYHSLGYKSKKRLGEMMGHSPIFGLPDSPTPTKVVKDKQLNDLFLKELGTPLETPKKKTEREVEMLSEMFPKYKHFIKTLFVETKGNVNECLEILLMLSRNKNIDTDPKTIPNTENTSQEPTNETKEPIIKKIDNKVDEITVTEKVDKLIEKKVEPEPEPDETKKSGFNIREHLDSFKKYEKNILALREIFPKTRERVIKKSLIKFENDITKASEDILLYNEDMKKKKKKNPKKKVNFFMPKKSLKRPKEPKKFKVADNVKNVYVKKAPKKTRVVQNVYAKISLKNLIQLSLPYDISVENIVDIYRDSKEDGNEAYKRIQMMFSKRKIEGSGNGGTVSSLERVSRYDVSYDDMIQKMRRLQDEKEECYHMALKSGMYGKDKQFEKYNKIAKEKEYKMKEMQSKLNDMHFERNNYRFKNYSAIDFHGLTVKEALNALREHIGICEKYNVKRFKAITGKGLHSKNFDAKIKPAVKKYLRSENISFKETKDKGAFMISLE